MLRRAAIGSVFLVIIGCISPIVFASNEAARPNVIAAPKSQILLIENVGDFFHTNDSKHVTPASGNRLDAESHARTLRCGARILKRAIQLALARFQQVHVINARGNHDPDAAIALNIILEAVFEKEKRVKVIPNEQKYIPWVFGDKATTVL